MRVRSIVATAGVLLLAACDGGPVEPTSARLVVKITTTGVEQDPDGYTLSIGGWGDTTVATNARLQVDVPPEWYYVPDPVEGAVPHNPVTLSGVATNCVDGGPYGDVLIHAGEIDSLTFTMTCSATTGTLAVRVASNGVALDPDGYTIAIDGGGSTAVGANGNTSAATVAVGVHSVTLSGVVMNCAPDSAGPYSINVASETADTLSIHLTCAWPRVAVQVGGTGVGLINPDGTNEQTLLVNSFGNGYANPAWAPDRTAITVDFQSNGGIGARGIGILPVDSTTIRPLVKDSLTTRLARWSPDGASLIIVRPDSGTGTWRLYSALVAGGPIAALTPDSLIVFGGDWSSDGSKIAFTAQGPDLKTRLYVIQSGGGGLARITPDSLDQVGSARWSPVDDRIVFIAQASLWTIAGTGGTPTKITIPGYVPNYMPAWSPLGDEFLVDGTDPITGGGTLLRISTTGTIHAVLPLSATGAYINPDWR